MYPSYKEDNGLPLPLKGTSKTFYERLSHYISLFDETWESRIRPIEEDQLQKFERCFALENDRVKLPDTYYCFLQKMGKNDGGLITDTIDGYSEISLDVLMTLYGEWSTPYVPFIEVPISGFALFFNLNENCKITEIFRPERIYGSSKETFEQLIFRCAFKKFFRQIGRKKLESLYPNYDDRTFQIELEQNSDESDNSFRYYQRLVTTIQKKFLITEEWFSNQDGLLTDCYVGTTPSKDSVITIENRLSYLNISISGSNAKMIDDLTNFLEEYGRI